MKGFRFYKEYDSPQDKRKDKPNGNVFASYGESYHGASYELTQEGFAAVFFEPNSPRCFTSVSWDWIHDCCKRISEAEARQIHPRLFERIEL